MACLVSECIISLGCLINNYWYMCQFFHTKYNNHTGNIISRLCYLTLSDVPFHFVPFCYNVYKCNGSACSFENRTLLLLVYLKLTGGGELRCSSSYNVILKGLTTVSQEPSHNSNSQDCAVHRNNKKTHCHQIL